MKLYIKIAKPLESSKDIIPDLFTHDISIGFRGAITYFNEELTEIHCLADAYRSIDDVITVHVTYYPEITIEEIAFNVFSSVLEDNGPQFGLCDTIGKPTMYYGKYSFGCIGTEYLDHQKDAMMSWNQLAKKVGINNIYELKKFNNLFKNTSFEEYLQSEWRKRI